MKFGINTTLVVLEMVNFPEMVNFQYNTCDIYPKKNFTATHAITSTNCPDLILLLKKKKHTFLVDFSCSFDSNVVSKEVEKVEKF